VRLALKTPDSAAKGPVFDEVITRPPVTWIWKLTVPVTGMVAESVAVTVNSEYPLVFRAGVPEIDPSELNLRPNGRTPDVRAYRYVD